MHEYLLQHHQNDLNNCGMEGCDNAGHVLECALQEVILQPLSHFVYLRIEEYYATNGHLFQVQRSIHQGKLKTTEEMGIRVSLGLGLGLVLGGLGLVLGGGIGLVKVMANGYW